MQNYGRMLKGEEPNAAEASRRDDIFTGGKTKPVWISSPRQIHINFRCDPHDDGMLDPASVMMMSRRVVVKEDPMCSYIVEWPTVYGCPVKAASEFETRMLAMRKAAAPYSTLIAIGALPMLAFTVQVIRQW